MSSEYMKYIPQILSNHKYNAILLTTIPALLYTAAVYASSYMKGITLLTSITVSCIFAISEYIIRTPINHYSIFEAKFSNFELQAVWVVIILSMAWLTDKIYPRNKKEESTS